MRNNKLKTLLAAVSGSCCLSLGILISGITAQANENPCYLTDEMRAEYEQEGTLEERIQFNESLGTENVDSGLLQKALQRENGYERNVQSDRLAGASLPTAGDAKVLLFMVDFQDIKFEDEDTADRLYNSAFGTGNREYPYENLAAYYERASYETLHISGEVYSYTASKNRVEYTNNISGLVEEMLMAKDNEIDYSQYDGDGDGVIDCIYFHFAGPNEGWGSSWWSYCQRHSGIQTKFDSMSVGTYVALQDSAATETMIHESGHAMGLPDYYSYKKDHGFEDGICTWDMMSDNQGDHNGFSKWLLGWIKDEQVLWVTREENEETTRIQLETLSKNSTPGEKKIAVIAPEKKGMFSEYLLVEYDTNVGNQEKMHFGENNLDNGFRVFHIDAELNADQSDFKYKNNSKGQIKLIELVDPDGMELHSAGGNNAAPGISDRTKPYHCKYFPEDSLTPVTNPSTVLYDIKYASNSGIYIENFKCDDTIGSFDAHVEAVQPPDPESVELQVYNLWNDGDQSDFVWIPYDFSKRVESKMGGPNPYLVDETGQIVEIDVDSSFGKPYSVRIRDKSLKKGRYEIVLPEGMYNLGMEVDSKEYRIPIQIGELGTKITSTTVMEVQGMNICEGDSEDFYLLYRSFEGKLILSHMKMEGELESITIDEENWEGWNKRGDLQGVIRLQDGTFVTREGIENSTKFAHFDQNGSLLDPILTVDGWYARCENVGNTLKLVKYDQDRTAIQLCSIKFPGTVETYQPQIDPFHQRDPYLFFDEGYLVKEIVSNEKKVYFYYYDQENNLKKTFTVPFEFPGMAAAQSFLEFPAAAQHENKLYLLQWADTLAQHDDITLRYINSDLNLHILNMDTGEIESTTCLLKNVRLLRNIDYHMQDSAEFQVTDRGMVLRIDSNSIGDVYWFDTNGVLKARRSSWNRAANEAISGNVLAISQYTMTNGVEVTCYRGIEDEPEVDPVDPVEPEVDPVDPVKPKDDTGSLDIKPTGNSGKKTKVARTGDPSEIGIYIVLSSLSVVIMIAVIIILRKKHRK